MFWVENDYGHFFQKVSRYTRSTDHFANDLFYPQTLVTEVSGLVGQR